MAIYHFSAQVLGRRPKVQKDGSVRPGSSAVAAAAYRSGERLQAAERGEGDQRVQPRVHDYSKRSGVSHSEVMTPPGSDNPELAEFRDAGGKMIVFHGVSDPVFSVNDTADWYSKLDANNGGNAGEFAKFYPVPGMTHCSGGPAVEGFDMFAELVAWVENGTEPQAVTATARASNRDLPETMAGISRPLCPAPQVARYTGSDPASADSFTCE